MWTQVQANQFITIVMIIHHLKNSDEKTRKLLQMNQKIMIIRRTFSLFSKIFIFFLLFFFFSYLNVYNKNNHLSLWLFSSFLILSISSCLQTQCQERHLSAIHLIPYNIQSNLYLPNLFTPSLLPSENSENWPIPNTFHYSVSHVCKSSASVEF